MELFQLINQMPTCYEIISGKARVPESLKHELAEKKRMVPDPMRPDRMIHVSDIELLACCLQGASARQWPRAAASRMHRGCSVRPVRGLPVSSIV